MFPRKHRNIAAYPALGNEGWNCVPAIPRPARMATWPLALLGVAPVFGCCGGSGGGGGRLGLSGPTPRTDESGEQRPQRSGMETNDDDEQYTQSH